MYKNAIVNILRPDDTGSYNTMGDCYQSENVIIEARKYLKNNKIKHYETGAFGLYRIEFKDKSDMLFFLLLFHEDWGIDARI